MTASTEHADQVHEPDGRIAVTALVPAQRRRQSSGHTGHDRPRRPTAVHVAHGEGHGQRTAGSVRGDTPAPSGQVALTTRQRRARQRRAPSRLAAVTGVLALLSAVAPNAPAAAALMATPPDVGQLLAGRAGLALLGTVLLVAARLLARGSHAAWAMGAAGCLGVLLADLALARCGPASGAAVLTLVGLTVGGTAFDRPLRSQRGGRCVLVGVGLLVLAAHALATGGTGLLQSGLAVAALASLAPVARRHLTEEPGTGTSRAFAERWGRSSTAPLLALPDNDRLLLCDGQALAGLSVRNGVAISLGVPVAAESHERCALAELVTSCESAGRTPALLGLDERQRRMAGAEGFSAIKIGEEAVLDVASFSTEGKRRANVRHSVTRARKDGVVVLRYDATTRSAGRDAQLAAISAAWLGDKGGPELGFTLGRFDLDRLDDQEVYAALTGIGTSDERVVAFTTWLPYDDGDAAVLDLMRRAEPCPPGVMECLVVDAVADFAARGRSTASLGGVPMACTSGRSGPAQRLMGWAYEHGGSVYAAKGLFRFKDKFVPTWQPLYLAYPCAADLPRIGLAVLRAFLPPGTVRALVRSRLVRPGRRYGRGD